MPRPIRFCPEKQAQVVACVSLGASLRSAARAVGLSHTTLIKAARRNPDFAESLRRAALEYEFSQLRNLVRRVRQSRSNADSPSTDAHSRPESRLPPTVSPTDAQPLDRLLETLLMQFDAKRLRRSPANVTAPGHPLSE